MIRSLIPLAPLLLLTACGDPDESRATTDAEQNQPTEAAEGSARPDVINRSEAPDEPGDLAGVPLKPAFEEVDRSPPYLGAWAPDLSWCENQSGAEVPIQLTEDTFGGYENPCDITQIRETGRHEWEAELNCTGEHQNDSRRITIAVEGNRMDVVYHEIADQRISYYRCVPELANPASDVPIDDKEPLIVAPPD